MPARITRNRVIQPESEIPIFLERDVVVVGGGPGGCAAAIASAREGVSTILIERYGYLGGLTTGGLVLRLEGFSDEEKFVVKGIGKEIVDRVVEARGGRWEGFNATCDPEVLKYVALKMCKECGVEFLFHALCVDTVMEDGRVRGVIVETKSGRMAILGKVVIDATGDGDVFASAGARFNEGQRGLGLVFRLAGVDLEQANRFKKEREKEFNQIIDEIKKRLFFPIIGFDAVRPGVVWWPNMTQPLGGLDAKTLSEVEVDLREKVHEVIELVKERLPGFENAFLLDTATQLGVRESRLLSGEYVLLEQDLVEGRRFDDAVAHLGYGGKKGVGYDLPYRCLLPKDVDGLLVCGRCISTDHYSQNLTRVVANCFATGQATGVASAMSVKKNIEPRTLDRDSLRQRLTQTGVYLET
jgi:ribulose 1,5-bisphosphate synthetase/thiazole synthase